MNISLFLGLLVSTIAGFMPGKFRISNLNLSPLFLGFGYGYEKNTVHWDTHSSYRFGYSFWLRLDLGFRITSMSRYLI